MATTTAPDSYAGGAAAPPIWARPDPALATAGIEGEFVVARVRLLAMALLYDARICLVAGLLALSEYGGLWTYARGPLRPVRSRLRDRVGAVLARGPVDPSDPAGDRHHTGRHDRSPGPAAALPCGARPAHGTVHPRALRSGPHRGDGKLGTKRPAAVTGHSRSRPLQGDQRRPRRAWHWTGLAVGALLGTANLAFWQIFIATDALPMGYRTTFLHWLFVALQLAALLSASAEAAAGADDGLRSRSRAGGERGSVTATALYPAGSRSSVLQCLGPDLCDGSPNR